MPPSDELFFHRCMIVREILNRYDPADLMCHWRQHAEEAGEPFNSAEVDEYDPELRGVLRAIDKATDAHDLGQRVAAVFYGMFGRHVIRNERWDELGAELWRITRTRYWHETKGSSPS